MILTPGIDLNELTEFDRLFCLMVFFQMSFYKDPVDVKCPHCGVDIKYRYDMSKYLSKIESAYVPDQIVQLANKSKVFEMTIGWPSVKTISNMDNHFYGNLGQVTEEMEQTQYGINLLMSFVKKIKMINSISGDEELDIDLTSIPWQDRVDLINSLPSILVFDNDDGLFSKITGYFINRLENCFQYETCPQCHKETYNGISQSSHFYGLFYGSLKSIYGYIVQIECLLIYQYDCCIFDKEQFMTYNDLNTLVHQIGTTAEKENQERRKIGNDKLIQGLAMIRDILNFVVFPGDKKKK